MNIYLGNIPLTSTEGQIFKFLEGFGTICDINYPKDSVTGKQRGFAFFTIADKEEATAAIEKIDGSEFQGRNLRASEAKGPDRAKTNEIPTGFRRPGEMPQFGGRGRR